MKLPDITPAQIKADVLLVVGVAGSLGLKVDGQVSSLVTVALIAAFTLAHVVAFLADAKIRNGRAQASTSPYWLQAIEQSEPNVEKVATAVLAKLAAQEQNAKPAEPQA